MFGTTGNASYAKQKEIYERNGSPLGPYSGNLQQNTWLLNNKDKWKPAPAPTPAPAQVATPAKNTNVATQFVNENKAATTIAPNPMDISFKWTDADIKRALAIAEKNIGPYFADLLRKTIETSNISKERMTADIAKNISDAEQKLTEYLQKSDTERTRIEEDFTKAKEETARSLGVDLDTLELSKERDAEDKDRQLAEAHVDYETTGGRISDSKLKMLEDNSEYMASKGLTFSGKRVEGEMDIEKVAQQKLDDLNTQYERTTGGAARSYERNLSDLNRQEKLRKEQSDLQQKNLELSAGRSKEDLATQSGIVQRDTGSYIQGQELSKTRTLEDIKRELEEKQLAIEREKAEQMRINPIWGVQTQEETESQNYLDRYANADAVRTDPSRIQELINASAKTPVVTSATTTPTSTTAVSQIGQSLTPPRLVEAGKFDNAGTAITDPDKYKIAI